MKKIYSILCALLVGTASLFAQAPDGYMEMGAFSENFTNASSISNMGFGWGWQGGAPNSRSYSTSTNTSYSVNGKYVLCSTAYEATSQTTPTLLITPMLKGAISFKVSPKFYPNPTASNFTGNKSFVRLFAGHMEESGLVWDADPFFQHYFTEAPASSQANAAAYWITCNTSLEEYQFVGIQLSYIAFDELSAESYCMPIQHVMTPTVIVNGNDASNPIYADATGAGTWTGSVTVKNEGDVPFADGEAKLLVTSQGSSSLITTTMTEFVIPDNIAPGDSKTYNIEVPLQLVNPTVDGNTAVRFTTNLLKYGNTEISSYSYKQSSWFNLKAKTPKLIVKNKNKNDVINYTTELGQVTAPVAIPFTLKNDGGSPVVLQSITSAALTNLSWTCDGEPVVFPFTIEIGEERTFTMAFGDFGAQAGTLVFNYNDTYKVTSKDVTAFIADPSLYLEQFAAKLPNGWLNEEGSNWAITSGTNSYMHSNNVEMKGKYLISPKLHFEAGQTLTISAQGKNATTSKINVYTSTDRVNWTLAKAITTWPTGKTNSTLNTSYAQPIAVDMPAGDVYVGFESGYAIIDYIYGGTLASVDDDFYMTIAGENKGMVNFEYALSVNLTEMGNQAHAEGKYTLEVLSDAKLAATADVPAIAAYAKVENIAIAFTPHVANEITLLTVNLKKGNKILNTLTKTVDIKAEALPEEQTGTIYSAQACPFYNSYMYSRSEWVYPASKIDIAPGTKLTSITLWHGTNASKASTGTVKIWLENTDATIIGASMYDVAQMTEVFNEEFTFPLKGGTSVSALEPLTFTFSTPFEYTGGNLRITMAAEGMNTGYHCYGYENGVSNSVLRKYSGTESGYNSAAGSKVSYFPVAMFGYDIELPSISGKLTDNQGNALANQEIIARSGDIIYSANTDAEGNYSIEVMQADKIYNINIMVRDAEYTAIKDISLSAGSVADQDITHPADHIRANLTVGKVGTICLPYNAIATEGATFYKLIEKDAAGKNIIFESVDVLEAGHAYIYESETEMIAIYKGSVYEATPIAKNGLVGTYDGEYFTGTDLADKYYFSQNKVWPAAGLNSLTVGANRAYIDWTDVPAHGEGPAQAPGSRRYVLGNGAPAVTTAVENINADENASKMMINGQIYILRGENMYDMTGRLVK